MTDLLRNILLLTINSMKKNLLHLLLLIVALVMGTSIQAKDPVYIETDLTNQFPLDYNGWANASGFVGWAAPTVKTNDGRETAACERYESTCETLGEVFTRTFTGLTNGTYKIELYGAAAYTSGRGFESELEEGDETAVYLFAETPNGTIKQYIPAHIATDFNGTGIATATLDNVVVTDGTIKLGMFKDKAYTNWHVIQIKGVTALVDAVPVYTNLLKQATVLENSLIPANAKNALIAAMVDDNSFTTADQYTTAINNLTNAIATAKNALSEEKFYFRNIATGKFWGAGNDWGTRGSLVDEFQYAKLHLQDDGTYYMETLVSNGGTSYYFGGDYMDGNPVKLTITKDGDNYLVAQDGNYFGYDGSTTVLGKNIDVNSENAKWDIMAEADLDAYKATIASEAQGKASLDAPFDFTPFIKDAQFNRNRRDRDIVWNASASNKNLAGGFNNDTNRNSCAESYHSTLSLSQEVTGLPNGLFMVTAQGFYRQDGGTESAPVITANGEKQAFNVLTTGENSMEKASTTFVNGGYPLVPLYVNVTDNKLTIGINGSATSHWIIWDNIQLFYCGNSKDEYVAGLKSALTEESAISSFETAVANAETLDEIKAALQAAIRTQTTEGVDYSGVIVNPSFETSTTFGWTYEPNGDHGAKTYEMEGKDGKYLFNIWETGNAITQTIENLPNGNYTLKAVAASDNGNKILLTANGVSTEIEATDANTGIEGELTFAVTDGKAIIGAEGADQNWYKVDNFRLEYAGSIATVSSLEELAASDGAVIFEIPALEVVNVGNDSIVAQSAKGTPAGIMLQGVNIGADIYTDQIINGQVYGFYDAATHIFFVEANTGNAISTSNGEATINEMELTDAVLAENAYLLVKIEMANIVEVEEGVFYAKKNDDIIKLDKRIAPSLMLYDDEFVNSITGVTFLEDGQCVLAPLSQDDIRSNKAEAEDGSTYCQGEIVNTVNGIIMNYGGNGGETEYEFAAVDPAVNKLGTKTEGIDQFPVDDNDKAYDPEQKNLPTKGTYYVFTATKDGQLDVTVDLEKNKKLYVTEGAEALKDFNGITTVKNNLVSFPVEAMKTYYVFANETNLGYYGFNFSPKDAYAKNVVKDIATFKKLPMANEDGDTLLLNNAVVTYIKGDNVYVEDESGAIIFYQTGIQFYVGQQLNGYFLGSCDILNGMPALMRTANTKDSKFKVTKTTPEAKLISVEDTEDWMNAARFAKLENVVLSKDNQGFKILLDEESGKSVRIEDHFNVFYELKSIIQSIEGIIGTNIEGTVFFWPTSKEGVVSTDAIDLSLKDGKYVLKNVASGLYWGAGNNWGTRASLLDYSEFQTLAKQPDGTYTLESQVSNGGTAYYFEGDYMDNANPKALTITPVEVAGEEIVDFNGSFYHNWSEVSGTATDNGSANGGVKLNEEVSAGGALWGNLTGAVPFKSYANLTDYDELRFEGTPGATIRLMCNRVVDEGPIFEIQPKIGDDGKLTVNISDLKFLNGGTPCDFVCLQSIKIPWGGAAASLSSIKLVKSGATKTYYTIADGDKYYGYSTAEDAPYTTGTAILGKGLSANDENALWEIVPATADALASATEKNPVDATFMILNPNFGRNNRNAEAWTMDAGNKNLCGGTNENKCAESWRSAFTLSQEIEVPNGVYALTAQAALTDYAELWDGAEYPVVYANAESMPFNNMEGSDRSSNMNTLSAAFANGNYKVGPIYLTVTDGKLTIGVKGTRTDTWAIWDNFQLKYYGTDANIDNLKGGAENKELDELRKKAADLSKEVEIAAVKAVLDNAISETANVSGDDAIKAAIATLKAAVDKGEASKTAKNILPKMKELIDATNVYTQEAYDQYYGTWLAKYQDGSLTKAEAGNLQDPDVVTGWHAQITVDNFLLSAWDTNPDFNDAAYYINSWSIEGDSDGSNFHVPFFEYWTGDDSSLGEKTLTATMNGLAAGEYDVTAWVRVRAKNGYEAPAYGIDLQVNDGQAVNVAAGEQIGDTQFFLKEFTATGKVGADGVLNIKFNVGADNNISWLSFKNVKFEKKGGEPVVDPDLIEIAQNQGKDLDDFQRAELVEGSAYNTYTANADLVIAFKMMNIDVKDCDYVVIKFAEPVAAGWHLAFWANQDLVDVPAGATEFKYVFADDPKCGVQDGILPQICMMTFFGGYQAPLVAKVTGIYKHKVASNLVAGSETELDATGGASKNEQVDGTSYYIPGDYIAGKGSSQATGMTSKGFKLRTGNGSDPKESAVIMVKEGFIITDLTLNGVANYAANAEGACIKVTKVEVDGKEVNFTDGAFPEKGAADCGTLTLSSINAKESIKLYFDNSNAAGTQLNIAYAINYLAPATDGISETVVERRFEDGAVYNLRGQKVTGTLKKGLYIINGKKVVIK